MQRELKWHVDFASISRDGGVATFLKDALSAAAQPYQVKPWFVVAAAVATAVCLT